MKTTQQRFGLPYKGSKNSIAMDILRFLPAGNRLCDLCGGGGAITHAALSSGTWKWQKFLYNEINPLVCKAFSMAVHGDFKGETRWISREEFFRLKDTDPYAAFCFSFSNDLKTYCYGKDIEPWKKAVHYARVLGDTSLLASYGISLDGSREDIRLHFEEYRQKYGQKIGDRVHCGDLESLQSLERLESLQSLERLQSQLTITCDSYESYSHLPGDVVYLDIPYEDTDCGSYSGFSHRDFYAWASTRPYQIFFSSYPLPSSSPFFLVWQQQKRQLCNDKDNSTLATECIYSNFPVEHPSLLPEEPMLFDF